MKLRRHHHTNLLLRLLSLAVLSSCGYLQMNPPPDVEMEEGGPNRTAWLAAPSNMLAAAGYGIGKNPQEKAVNIYNQLTGHFGTTNTGWTDAALQWWLQSEHNKWPGNPYKLVTVEGYKNPSLPWSRRDGANLIAARLRAGQFIAASISWPGTPDDPEGKGGHVLNCWGDNRKEKNLSGRIPEHLRVTDSYSQPGGIIQTYPYDAFNSPNPGGASAGYGWYIEYDENHPFIRNIIMLSPVFAETESARLSRYLVSMKTYNESNEQASGITYTLATSEPLLQHSSAFIPGTKDAIGSRDRIISVQVDDNRSVCSFNLPRNSVGQDQSLTFFSSFVSRPSSWISLDDISFLYDRNDRAGVEKAISFRLKTPLKDGKLLEKGFCGGYLLGSFQAIPSADKSIDFPCEVRFIEQYPYDLDPEKHVFMMSCDSGTRITNVRFGHSYGWIGEDSLWSHEQWITFVSDTLHFQKDTLSIDLQWKNLLPYPKGEELEKALRFVPL